MSLQLGSIAPNFEAVTTAGKINFHTWLDDTWCVLFSHPKDFTPVCTTELGETSKLKEQFEDINTKVIALSVDNVNDHIQWIKDIDETQQTCVNFPIIDDSSFHISKLYGMIHPESSDSTTVRSVFIIDPMKKIRLTMTYPASTGRNFKEIIRALKSLQLTDKYKLATPVNWIEGERSIVIPSVSNQDAMLLFNGEVEIIKPYLRYVETPKC
jgi:alkyl hydroperoxide reductase subunit AhpC